MLNDASTWGIDTYSRTNQGQVDSILQASDNKVNFGTCLKRFATFSNNIMRRNGKWCITHQMDRKTNISVREKTKAIYVI